MAKTKSLQPTAVAAAPLSQASVLKTIFDYMRDYVEAEPTNPVSQLKVVIAKNLSYENPESDEAFTLLCPLASCDTFAYIKAYQDSRGDVNHVLNISEIRDLVWNDELGFYTFSIPHMNSEANKFSKGIRYCAKFAEYFDSAKNANLYKTVKNTSTLVPEVKFYDSDKAQYRVSGGYVEISNLKQSHEGENYSFSLVKSTPKVGLDGTRAIPKIFMILNEEWLFFGRFMEWICVAYSVIEGESNLEQKRIQNTQKSLFAALGKRKMKRIEEEKAKKAKKSESRKSKKKLSQKADIQRKEGPPPSIEQGVSAAMSLAAIKSLNIHQQNDDPGVSSANESEEGENGQNPYQIEDDED